MNAVDINELNERRITDQDGGTNTKSGDLDSWQNSEAVTHGQHGTDLKL